MTTTPAPSSAFTPFARADFWASKAPQEPFNPALALSYANLVLGFWRDCKNLYPGTQEPLYIFEMGAAAGHFTHQFLLCFFEQFEAIATPTDRVVYVYTDADEANLLAARQHKKLIPYVKQGRLDFAQFNPAAPGPITLQEANLTLIPHKMTYPPVIIANGVLSRLRQDMFVLEHHTLYEAWVATSQAEPDTNAASSSAASAHLHYQKRPLTGTGYTDSTHQDLLEHYRQTLPCCTLYFPFQALALLKSLHSLQGREALLLSADTGLHLLAEVTNQAEYQPSAAVRPPVNFHALDRLVQAQGGSVWHSVSEGPSSSSVFAAAIGSRAQWPETQRAAWQSLIRINPNDTARLQQALASEAEYLSLPEMLAFLRAHQWDSTLFSAFLPFLQLNGLDKTQQDLWRIALARIWAHHFPHPNDESDLAFDLASVAARMHRWRYAIDLFSQSLTFKGPQSATYANIGIAHWQMGNLTQAEKALRTALPLWQAEQQADDLRAASEHPDAHTIELQANPIQTQLDALNLWQNKVRSLLGPNPLLRAPGEANNPSAIGLTLLGSHHAEALYMHQRHSSLARQVGVRALNSVRDAERWIEQESAANKTPLAIMHPQYGLIGLAVLETATALLNATHNLARFYYWVTPAQQNQGFGSQALALLHSFAQGYGIKYLFSAVHRANGKSQRAMAKTGYQRLNFTLDAASADENGVDFYLNVLRPGAAASEFERYQAFAAFIQTFGEPITLAPFEGAEELEVTRLKLSEPASTAEA